MTYISLKIVEHEFVWLTGSGDSGIKALIEICCGFIRPDQGEININGYQNLQSSSYRKEIDYLSYHDYWAANKTIVKNLWVPRSVKNVDTILYENGILDSHALIYELSHEQKLQVMLSRAILKQAKILFCYEWMNELDMDAKKRMMQRLMYAYHKYHLTIVYAAHQCPNNFRQIHLEHGYIAGDKNA